MARFHIEGPHLHLEFSGWERLGGLRSGARIPLSDVASVEVAPDPWAVLSGLRVGTGIPYVIVLGTMVRRGPSDVVAVYGRAPAVVVTLRPGAAHQRLIATVPAPESVAAELRAARGAR